MPTEGRLASGTQYRLEVGGYRAEIASVGASLRSLTHRGRDLVLPYRADEVRPRYRGAVLAPWPNRIGSGSWPWRGTAHQLPINEPEHDSALHGLALWLDWTAVSATDSAVTLGARIMAQPGYPFTLDLTMAWTLSDEGLLGELVAVNVGDDDAPYAAGVHPYLVAAPGEHVDNWTLQLPATRRLEVDKKLLPRGGPEAPPSESNFVEPQVIGRVVIDNAYTALDFGDEGVAAAVVLAADGHGVRMEFGRDTPWVQVHTADRPDEPGQHRRGLAVEPMTGPPNAFVTGVDLHVLAPGDAQRTRWRISAV